MRTVQPRAIHYPEPKCAHLGSVLTYFMEALGERWFRSFRPCPVRFPEIPQRTWRDLLRRKFLKPDEFESSSFHLTPLGYLIALRTSGVAASPDFQWQLRNLFQAMKHHVRRKRDFALVPIAELARESHVTLDFAYNVLDADLVFHLMGKIGANWDGEHFVAIPSEFGLPPLCTMVDASAIVSMGES